MSTITLIAEIAGGHEGQLSRCLDLVKAAADSGANAVKFQFYKADELCQKSHPDYALFKKLEFSMDDWKQIYSTVRSLKMRVFADIFGNESLEEALALDTDGFKFHSADLDNPALLTRVARTGKEILLGVGGHKRVEIFQALQLLRSIPETGKIILMPGHQLFPTPVAEHSLAEIRWFLQAYKDFGVQVGCADHIDGDDAAAAVYPLAAIGAGATIVEKHLTLNRTQKWEDYESALNPDVFKKMAASIELVAPTTSAYPRWTEGREKYRRKALKAYIARENLGEGMVVQPEALDFVRPTQYSDPVPSAVLFGRKIRQPTAAGEVLNASRLQTRMGILVNARMASTRLPGKASLKLCGKETIALLIERMQHCKKGGKVILCTTERPEDDVLAEIGRRENVDVFRGPNENVALRLLMALKKYDLDHFVRVTGDDLLRDIPLIDEAIESHLANNADYTAMEGVVYSCDSEIISRRALETIVERASVPDNTEYLTWYLDDASAFVQNRVAAPADYARPYRLTLDTEADFKLFNAIYEALYQPGKPVDLVTALRYLDQHPEISGINRMISPKLAREALDVSIRI